MSKLPTEKPGPHHDHEGHVPGDLDPHGHRDTSAQPGDASGNLHHAHPGHKPDDVDPQGHRDTGASKMK